MSVFAFLTSCDNSPMFAGDNRATPVGGDTRRQVKINRLPQVLIVNLKRFEVVGRRLQKRHDPVETTPELDVAPFCTEECIEKVGGTLLTLWITPPRHAESFVSHPA